MADNYQIISQAPRVRALPGGQFGPTIMVTFETKPHKIYGTVDIPEQAFTTSEVDRVVRDKAALLEAVMEL